MAGIYIHIPFCRQKCHYCNFYSVVSERYRMEFPDALIREAQLRKDYPGLDPVDTIYLGGGTPSLIASSVLDKILEVVFKEYNVSDDAEITLEANPDDVTSALVQELKKSPVNRISLGVQSFLDKDLHYLNRVHDASQAVDAIHRFRDGGISSLTIDLIYGLPTQSSEDWEKNLEYFFSFDLPHLSAYALTVEPGTALEVLIRKGKMNAVEDRVAANHFGLLMDSMEKEGYQHYEISNFCKPGARAKHNTGYWTGTNYLGLGPSAHSYDGTSRQWNTSVLKDYIHSMEQGQPDFSGEVLSRSQKYNEYVMVSLRTMWGVDTSVIEDRFGQSFYEYFESEAMSFLADGRLERDETRYYLTRKGKLFADGIAAHLFWSDSDE